MKSVAIGILACIGLASCTPSENGGANQVDVFEAEGDTSISWRNEGGPKVFRQPVRSVIREGQLPLKRPSASIVRVQSDLAEVFARGVDVENFPGPASSLDNMLVEFKSPNPQGWEMGPDGKQLFLVKRHLIRIPTQNRAGELTSFCQSDELYSGYAAARPYTRQMNKQAQVMEVMANPYGVLVCVDENEMRFKLINSGQLKSLYL